MKRIMIVLLLCLVGYGCQENHESSDSGVEKETIRKPEPYSGPAMKFYFEEEGQVELSDSSLILLHQMIDDNTRAFNTITPKGSVRKVELLSPFGEGEAVDSVTAIRIRKVMSAMMMHYEYLDEKHFLPLPETKAEKVNQDHPLRDRWVEVRVGKWPD